MASTKCGTHFLDYGSRTLKTEIRLWKSNVLDTRESASFITTSNFLEILKDFAHKHLMLFLTIN